MTGWRRRLVVLVSVLLTLLGVAPTALAGPMPSVAASPATSVTVRASGLNANVTWVAPADADRTAWVVSTDPATADVRLPAGARSTVLTQLRPNRDYTITVTSEGSAGSESLTADGSVRLTAPGGSFVPLTPERVLDTRSGLGVAAPGTIRQIALDVRSVVPETAQAIAMNVTVTNPAGPGWITAWPSGRAKPTASNINYVRGQQVANLVVVPIGADRTVSFYSEAATHLIADVSGYFTDAATADPNVGLYHPVSPTRLVDTRRALGASTPGAGESIKVAVLGEQGLPAANVSAVAVNITVASPSRAGWVTAWPSDVTMPTASTLNFAAGQVVANRAIVPLAADGSFAINNALGTTPLIVDVTGYFTGWDDDLAGGSYFAPVTPERVVDTRTGLGAPKAKLGATTLPATIAGRAGLPAATSKVPATGALATVTLVRASKTTWATIHPGLTTLPSSSDLNATAGQTVPNVSMGGLGVNGKWSINNANGEVDLLVDVAGYFVGDVHVPDDLTVAPTGTVAAVSGSAMTGAATVTLTAGAAAPPVGGYLASGVTTTTPKGLLVAVEAKSTDASGRVVLTTRPTTLQEVLGTGGFAIATPLDGAAAVPMGPGFVEGAPRVETVDDIERRLIDAPDGTPVTKPKATYSCSANAGSKVEAGLSITPSLNTEVDFGLSWSGPKVNAKAYAKLSEVAHAGITVKAGASCSWAMSLGKWRFPAITFSVGPVPVVIIPELTVDLSASTSGSASATTSVTQTFTAKAGIAYDDGKVSPIKEISNTFEYVPLTVTQANANAQASIKPSLIGRFYGVAGPSVSLIGRLTGDINLLVDPWWIVKFALKAQAGLHLDAGVVKLKKETPEYTLIERVLGQASPRKTVPRTLTFDELPVWTSVSQQYRPLGIDFGWTHTSPDGSNATAPVLAGADEGFDAPVPGYFVNPDGSPRTVSTFSVDVGWIDQPGSTEIVAFDLDGRLLRTVVATQKGINRLTVTAPGIASFIVRTRGIEDAGFAIDNLAFQGFAGTVAAMPGKSLTPTDAGSSRRP